MRHIKYRKAYGNILFKIFRCNQLTNWSRILEQNATPTTDRIVALLQIIKKKAITSINRNAWKQLELSGTCKITIWIITAVHSKYFIKMQVFRCGEMI
jgi:hypothetical protein